MLEWCDSKQYVKGHLPYYDHMAEYNTNPGHCFEKLVARCTFFTFLNKNKGKRYQQLRPEKLLRRRIVECAPKISEMRANSA